MFIALTMPSVALRCELCCQLGTDHQPAGRAANQPLRVLDLLVDDILVHEGLRGVWQSAKVLDHAGQGCIGDHLVQRVVQHFGCLPLVYIGLDEQPIEQSPRSAASSC